MKTQSLASFGTAGFWDVDLSGLQLDERGPKFGHFWGFAGPPIVFTQSGSFLEMIEEQVTRDSAVFPTTDVGKRFVAFSCK